jgi:hypothetical protein
MAHWERKRDGVSSLWQEKRAGYGMKMERTILIIAFCWPIPVSSSLRIDWESADM